VIAVLLGAAILGEHLSGREALGAGIVVLSVAGLLAAPRRQARREPEP
jgi:drug/metabolite transporter (DMT)-like permease